MGASNPFAKGPTVLGQPARQNLFAGSTTKQTESRPFEPSSPTLGLRGVSKSGTNPFGASFLDQMKTSGDNPFLKSNPFGVAVQAHEPATPKQLSSFPQPEKVTDYSSQLVVSPSNKPGSNPFVSSDMFSSFKGNAQRSESAVGKSETEAPPPTPAEKDDAKQKPTVSSLAQAAGKPSVVDPQHSPKVGKGGASKGAMKSSLTLASSSPATEKGSWWADDESEDDNDGEIPSSPSAAPKKSSNKGSKSGQKGKKKPGKGKR